MAVAPDQRTLPLLMEEYFSGEDDRFVETLRQIRSAKLLAAFAERWRKDPRPWARAQIFAYLEQPLDRPGHQPVIKRLFKQAEANQDDELMGAFVVAFDCIVRRVRRTRHHWDYESRSSFEEETLVSPRNIIVRENGQALRQPRAARLFTYRTRYYLRRRAWRFFRRMGFQKPSAYPAAVTKALIRYRDEDLAKGENILDCWGLLQICFGRNPALDFDQAHARLKEGCSLADLSATPRFPEVWQTP